MLIADPSRPASVIRTALKARKAEAADIDVRRNAIIHLVAMSTEQPPEQFHNTAVWGTRELPADFRDTNFLAADLARSKWANVDFDGSNIGKATGQDKVAFFRHISGLTEEQRALFPGEGR